MVPSSRRISTHIETVTTPRPPPYNPGFQKDAVPRPTINANITLKVLDTNDDLPKVVDIATKAFMRNPVHVWRKSSAKDLHEYFTMALPKFASDGLSLIATDKQNPVGFLLNMDFMDPFYAQRHTADSAHLTSRTDLFELINTYTDWYKMTYFPHPKPGDIFLLELIGVEPQWTGKGLAQAMISSSIDLARNKGYRRALFQSINSVSTHIFKKNGFELLRSVEYETFKMKDGKRPFAGMKTAFPLETYDILEMKFSSHSS